MLGHLQWEPSSIAAARGPPRFGIALPGQDWLRPAGWQAGVASPWTRRPSGSALPCFRKNWGDSLHSASPVRQLFPESSHHSNVSATPREAALPKPQESG